MKNLINLVFTLTILLFVVLACVVPEKQFQADEKGDLQPRIKLLSDNVERSSRMHVSVVGEVQNISDEKIENLKAVVNYYDKNNNLISTDSALIEYHDLMPEQKSPFKVISNYNPAIETYTVSFSTLWGSQMPYSRPDVTPAPEKPKKKSK